MPNAKGAGLVSRVGRFLQLLKRAESSRRGNRGAAHARHSYEARDPFVSGQFPVCAATHDQGVRWLFDLSTLIITLDCRPGDRVLDLGAGSGFSSEMLARFGYEVVAIDPDRQALANNRRRPAFDRGRIDGEVRVAQAVAERLPFANASFDGAVGMNVLHHVEALDDAVSELARVLKPGAHAVFCEPGLDHLEASETKRAMREHGENDQPFDVLRLLRQALDAGFSDAMLTATLQPPLRMLPVQEIDLYLSGNHPRGPLTPAGVLEELHRRHAYAAIVRQGTKPKTSRYPGQLRCALQVTGLPPRAKAGERLTVQVTALNAGDTLWLAKPSRLGGFVTIGCKLLTEDGHLVSNGIGRTFLDSDVPPMGQVSASISLHLPAPLTVGRYWLSFDLIDELVCWFSDVDPDSNVLLPVLIG